MFFPLINDLSDWKNGLEGLWRICAVTSDEVADIVGCWCCGMLYGWQAPILKLFTLLIINQILPTKYSFFNFNILYHIFHQCHPKSTPTKSDIVCPSLTTVNIKVFGGEPGPAATLAPKLGPLGLVPYPHYLECQESRWRYRQRRRKMERNPSHGSAQMPKQGSINHNKTNIISLDYQGAGQLRERQEEGEERQPQGKPHNGSSQEDCQGDWGQING